MATFMEAMRGLLDGNSVEVNEDNILPGVQEMMRTVGNTGFIACKGPGLTPILQDLVDRGYAAENAASTEKERRLVLTDKGKAYIARIGGAKTRSTDTPVRVQAINKRRPDEPA